MEKKNKISIYIYILTKITNEIIFKISRKLITVKYIEKFFEAFIDKNGLVE